MKNDERVLFGDAVRERRRYAERKPNGHALNCVCRSCFEDWRAEQEPIRAELRRINALLGAA